MPLSSLKLSELIFMTPCLDRRKIKIQNQQQFVSDNKDNSKLKLLKALRSHRRNDLNEQSTVEVMLSFLSLWWLRVDEVRSCDQSMDWNSKTYKWLKADWLDDDCKRALQNVHFLAIDASNKRPWAIWHVQGIKITFYRGFSWRTTWLKFCIEE